MEYLEPGTRVEVNGLNARPDLNGSPATVVGYAQERERYQVKTDAGEELYLRPANVSKLAPAAEGDHSAAEAEAAAPAPAEAAAPAPAKDMPISTEEPKPTPAEAAAEGTAEGTATAEHPAGVPEYLEPYAGVEVSGLKARPDLNGAHGRVIIYVPDRERYQVRILGTGEEIYLRPANVARSRDAAAAIAAERKAAAAARAGAAAGAAGADGEGAAAAGGAGGQAAPKDDGAKEKEAILREANAGITAAAAAAAAAPAPPVEEIKDSEALLKVGRRSLTPA